MFKGQERLPGQIIENLSLGQELIHSWFLQSRKANFLVCHRGGFLDFAWIISRSSSIEVTFIWVVGHQNWKYVAKVRGLCEQGEIVLRFLSFPRYS